MSMNIFIFGSRNAEVVVKGKRKVFRDTVEFHTWQTPTDVTFNIMDYSGVKSRIDAYIAWVISQGTEVVERSISYTDDGEFEMTFTNSADRHISDFREWIKMCDEEGYEIMFQIG